MARVSVLIRARNEEKLLGHTLNALERQSLQDFEIILVDSGSTDRTLEIAQEFQRVRIIEIPPHTFTFGYALNVGTQDARGDIIVNLSAHAVPTGTDFLEAYLPHFTDPSIAGVYGRQVTLPEHRGLRATLLSAGFGPDTKPDTLVPYYFSNVNGAVRKSCWEECPFDQTMTGSEDWAWAKAMLERGYRIVYEPKAEVYHSHDETLIQIFRRARREAVGMKTIDRGLQQRFFGRLTWLCLARTCMRSVTNHWQHSLVTLKRPDVALYAVPYRIFLDLGYFFGWKRELHP